jgi:GTP cyclohydrolase III
MAERRVRHKMPMKLSFAVRTSPRPIQPAVGAKIAGREAGSGQREDFLAPGQRFCGLLWENG